MPDFLLELFSEEIPARMQRRAAEDLRQGFAAALGQHGLEAQRIDVFVTPRRLALIAAGLPPTTAAISEERRGPRADAPAQAVEGFLKSTGLTRDQLEARDDPKGRFLYAVIERAGRATAEVLAEIVPALVRGFAWPKSMRWGPASVDEGSFRWVRPLQSIIALLDGDVVPLEVAGVASDRTTRGHRFLHSGPVEIAAPAAYASTLRAAHVIVDPVERQAIIADHAARLAAEAGLELIEDEGLLVENAGLTEWPVPLLGSFDPAFLDVPPEVIQLTARVNQKYFVLRGRDGKLAPNFICVANIVASDGGAAIVAGNQKVLAARLSDAKFFWDQDRKQPLESYLPKLRDIVFHEKLGTVADKVERVAKLARWLVESGAVRPAADTAAPSPTSVRPEPVEGRVAPASGHPVLRQAQDERNGGDGIPADVAVLADMAEQAARLCKADLVTGMVGEFPELQGVMGGYYAAAQGEACEVAEAIRDHYKPVGQGDEVPSSPITVAVSLADKIDTLIAFFVIGEKPTGSRDPYALRRAALGFLSISQTTGLRVSTQALFAAAYWPASWDAKAVFVGLNGAEKRNAFEQLYSSQNHHRFDVKSRSSFVIEVDGETVYARFDARVPEELLEIGSPFEAPAEVLKFLIDRLKVQQREAGVRHDLIDAVFALGGEDDLVRLLARVKALQDFIGTEDGANLLAGYKRATNILRIEEKKDGRAYDAAPDRDLMAIPQEIELFAAVESVRGEAGLAVENEEFGTAMAALSRLRPAVDAFFSHVTVNDPEPTVRANRLTLLNRIREAVHAVADFSKIEG